MELNLKMSVRLGIQKVLHLHLEEAKKTPKIKGNYLVTEKLDGWFTYIDYSKETGWGLIHSRQERVIPSLVKNTFFHSLPTPNEDCRLISEAIIPGLDFHTLNGLLNRSKGECQVANVEFHLHDIVFPESLHLSNAERFNILYEIPETTNIKHIKLLSYCNDRDIWMHYANKVWEKGGEGIVLKADRAVYRPDKRDSSLMKVKLEERVIGECVSIYYTTGEKGNSNLNIEVRLPSGVVVDVRVPKHKDIEKIEENKSYILGQSIGLKCMCILPDGKLREPRFERVLEC